MRITIASYIFCVLITTLPGCGGTTYDGSQQFYERDAAPTYVHDTPKYMQPNPDDSDDGNGN